MKILMAQQAACIRNWKEAIALTARGHEVHEACYLSHLEALYGIPPEEQPYRSQIILQKADELLDIADWFDIVHCHNETDTIAMTMTVSDTPSVYDCHDLMSIRGLGYSRVEEAIANKHSQARLFVSEYQAQQAQKRYKFPDYDVLESYVLEDYLPEKKLPKRGQASGEFHLVYEGGINLNQNTHRFMLDVFRELVNAGIWVHVYGICTPDVRSAYVTEIGSPKLVFHNRLHAKDLIQEMTQYDMGLCVFNITQKNQHHLHSTLPNKLFEYLAAGLPIVASPLHELTKFIEKYRCGLTWTNATEIKELIQPAIESMQIDPHEFTIERHIHRVEEMYQRILERPKPIIPFHFDSLPWVKDEAAYAIDFLPEQDSGLKARRLYGMEASEETKKLEALVANGVINEL